MLKWLVILIVPSCLLFFGCSECQFFGDLKNKSATMVKKKLARQFPKDIAYPIIFSRFLGTKNLSTGEALLEISKLCVLSPLYTANDICGPTPLLAQSSVGIDKKIIWKLPITPAIFYWQQNLKPSQNLIVELIDNDGLPWPTTVTISQKDNLFTVQVNPIHELPKTRELFLVGNVLGSKGEKIETWLMPLLVLEGSQSKVLWAPIDRPAPVKAPKKVKKAKRRR